ncbi:hypothetical protein [uncultured Maribacter sp.]|uniref:hypothetical protein n=1 Tax=uncultured Maribacter sp. TaxID=431308 RepID=UPI0030DA9222|tara:strand:+ start:1018 stop:1464 length:447 start_codon:yes stop_codon:yes gene_type:complete
MRYILILLFVLNNNLSFGQKTSDITIISNNKNYQSSILLGPKVDVIKSLNKIVIEIGQISLGKYYDSSISDFLEVDSDILNTALEFTLKSNKRIVYSYPVNPKSFDFVDFDNKFINVKCVEICFTTYETNTIPIIVVESISPILNGCY